jgi:hypothetical protein
MGEFLAQSEFSDLLDIVLYVAIVALSALGWLAKKLIEYFGGPKAERKETRPDVMEAEEIEEPADVYPAGTGPRPMPPPARPATGRRGPRPVARPYPTPTAPPTRPVPRPGHAAPPTVERRPAPPPVTPRPQQPPPSPPFERRPPRELHLDLPSERVETKRRSTRRRAGLPSKRAPRERKRRPKLKRGVEIEILEPSLAQRFAPRKTRDVQGEQDELLAFVQHPTRQSLRQAIVMNEILGPPVGLRPFEDKF